MSTTPAGASDGSTYVLGHEDVEVQRLLLAGLEEMGLTPRFGWNLHTLFQDAVINAWAQVQK